MPETPETTPEVTAAADRALRDGHAQVYLSGGEKIEFTGNGFAAWYLSEVAKVRAKVHAELFGTPEEIAAREDRPRERDDPAEICERLAPGHHEQRVRAKVAEEMRRMAEGRRYYADGNPPGDSRTWLEAEVGAFNSAAKVVEGEVGTVLALLPSLMWTPEEAAHARGERR